MCLIDFKFFQLNFFQFFFTLLDFAKIPAAGPQIAAAIATDRGTVWILLSIS